MNIKIKNWGHEPEYEVRIVEFDILFPEDTTYDIFEIWKNEGKRHIDLKPCSHPLYRDEELREKVIKYAVNDYYENQREKVGVCDENK